MGLADVFTAVEARMTATLAALVPPVTPPLFRLGEDKLRMEDAPNRVVWVPISENIQGPHAQGGDGIRNPRPLRTRHCMVQAHIWGADPGGAGDAAADITATEAILGHLVPAIHDVLHGIYALHGGSWMTGQASVTSLGGLYVLTFEVQVPLTRELDILALVTAMPITPLVAVQEPTQ